MANRVKLDLKTNLPVVLIPKYADWRTTQYGQKLKLSGEIAPGQPHYPAEEVEYFFPENAVAKLLELGVVKEQAPKVEKAGEPPVRQFRVVGTPFLRIHQTEERSERDTSKKVKVNHYATVDAAGNEVRLAPQQPYGAGAAPASAGPAPAASSAPAASQAPRPPETEEERKEAVASFKRTQLTKWLATRELYTAGVRMAVDAMVEATGIPAKDLDQAAVVSLTNGAMIRAERDGISGYRGFAEHVQEMLAKAPAGTKVTVERPPLSLSRGGAQRAPDPPPSSSEEEEHEDDLPF